MNDINSYRIVSIGRNDNICKLFRGFDELLVHGFKGGLVSPEHFFEVTASFGNIAFESANEPFITIGMHVDLDIEQFPNFRMRKDQNSFHDNHFPWMDGDRFAGTVVIFKGVDRLLNVFAILQLLKVLAQQVKIYRFWMVKIDLFRSSKLRCEVSL